MKKIFTFFLALVASVGISSAAITVRLDPSSCSSWSTVRLWAWTDEGNVFDSWPGQIVSKDGDGWYAYTFSSSISSVNIIWTNGTDQTVDITGVTSSTCYELDSQTGTAIKVSVVNCGSEGGQSEPIVVSGRYKIGELYYNLNEDKTAEVTYELEWNENNYKGLTTANIPASVTYSGTTYSVTSIGSYALSRCSSLTSVTIPNSVTSIGDWAFLNCSSLTSVTIPNSVTSIGGGAFKGCSGLTSPVYNAHVFAFMPESYSGAYTIPDGIASIVEYAFSGCSSLTSVTIPNSITSIASGVFTSCTNLSAVHISDLAAWCNISFSYSHSSNPLCYAHHLYLDNDEITNLVIPSSVTNIKSGAFEGGSGITSVLIPNSVTYIGEGAFSGCALTSVTIESTTPLSLCETWELEGESETYCTDPDFGRASIYVPCGTLDAYKNAEGWSDYASKIKYAPYPSYAITKKAENGYISTTTTEFTICDEPLVECTANPNSGCYFVRWADGNTENPRTIELSQDTTMEAIFDYLLTGKCGKDSALTWTFEPASMALNITGNGTLSENYTYGTFIKSLTIGNEITSIGNYAFYGCNNLKNVIIGSSVKVLEAAAFAYCSSIETITCYSQRPPTVNQDALYGLDYSTIVYVPADYLETYKMHDAWGLYDVRPLGAKSTETTDVNVTPAENTAEVAWPAVSGAATYELVIKDKNGNVVCTLIFNANGQLTQIAFNAPARDNTAQAAGFAFTVTGLEEGTSYDLTITAKDVNGTTLDEKTIAFTTSGETGVDALQAGELRSSKVMRDGQVLIMRGGKMYNLQGVEVK